MRQLALVAIALLVWALVLQARAWRKAALYWRGLVESPGDQVRQLNRPADPPLPWP